MYPTSEQTPPTPPTAPTPVQIQSPTEGVGPANVYRAVTETRTELRRQLDQLEERRSDLQRDLQRDDHENDAGTQARIAGLDARIASLDAQIAAADAEVAKAAGVPGAIVKEPPRPPAPTDVGEIVGIGLGCTTLLLLPIVIAYARRIWRRSAVVVAPIPTDVRDKIDQLSTAVESIGLEVERIGEGQRFITRVLGEPATRSALAAQASDAVPFSNAAANPAYRSGY